jgi:hypothetical protein
VLSCRKGAAYVPLAGKFIQHRLAIAGTHSPRRRVFAVVMQLVRRIESEFLGDALINHRDKSAGPYHPRQYVTRWQCGHAAAVRLLGYTRVELAGLTNRKETLLRPHSAQSLWVGGFAMASKFAIGDKVDQAFSNHAEGTVVAIFTDRAGTHRYAVEMFGHRTIQVANEGSLVAHCNSAV